MKEQCSLSDPNPLTKSKTKLKWLVLFLSCISLFGDYYCFDNPGALHALLAKRFQNNSGSLEFEYVFNLMYSVYSLPNIILPLIGGVLIFKFGYRVMYLIFGFFVMIGQFVFAFGCSTKNIPLMLYGRVIFGLGGEGLNTTQNILIIQWFNKNELAFALGLCLSMARMGSVLNDIFSPIIAASSDVSSALWFGFSICSMSFVCTILLVYIDLRQDLLSSMKEIFNSDFRGNVSREQEIEERSLSSLTSLSKLFFMISMIGLLMYGGILPFNYIASSFLIKAWYNNEPTVEAQKVVGFAMGLPFLISSFLIPLLGLVIDKYGHRANTILISAVCGLITFILFLFINPIVPLILLGVTYSLFASIFWPSITLVVPKELLGIALGFCSSVQNLGLVFFPLFVAYTFTMTKSYELTLIFFIVLMSLAIIFGILITKEDAKNGYILNALDKGEEEGIAEKKSNKFSALSMSTNSSQKQWRNCPVVTESEI